LIVNDNDNLLFDVSLDKQEGLNMIDQKPGTIKTLQDKQIGRMLSIDTVIQQKTI